MKRNLLIASFALLSLAVHSQTPAELLSTWSSKSPIEKVYLHFDRENYIAGETIWFKAYMYSDFYPDTISTTLFAELIDPKGKVISTKTLPIVNATGRNQFELPDSIASGNYLVRAYTSTMLNHGDAFLYQQAIYVAGQGAPPVTQAQVSATRVDFFPEGGNLVEGLANSVAFKITDEFGQPVDRSGRLINSEGETLALLQSYHDGLGDFDFTPQPGNHYFVLLNGDASRYPLPDAQKEGVVLLLRDHKLGKQFEIHQTALPAGKIQSAELQPAYLLGQVQHHVAFTIPVDGTSADVRGVIDLSGLPSGILQVTLFSAAHLPLAERLVFIDRKEYVQPAMLITDTISFNERGLNHFTVSFPDSVAGSFSVAIIDPAHSIEAQQQESIISRLLLTSDLKGHINNPQYYFNAPPDSAAHAADLLMMTHGWRRFSWKALPALANGPLAYRDSGFITVAGRINQRESKRPLPDKDFFVMISPVEDSAAGNMQFMSTDSEGRFRLDSLIFFGNSRFFVSDINGKKSKWLDLYPDVDSIRYKFGVAIAVPEPLRGKTLQKLLASSSRLNDDYLAIQKAKGEMLQNVTVKVRKKSPIQEMEDRYTSGLFSSYSYKTIDLVHTDEKIYQRNIFEYIQGRVTGIQVLNRMGDYTLVFRNRFSVSKGYIPMKIFLDEMETDSRVVATIPADQIAMIKVFGYFYGSSGDGGGGAIAFYTKKGNDITSDLSTAADVFMFRGYSVVRDFYSPDYKQDPALARKDNRITLQWLPDIELAGRDLKIPVRFFNNDDATSFRVVLEGMTADGKLVFLEKTLESGKKGF